MKKGDAAAAPTNVPGWRFAGSVGCQPALAPARLPMGEAGPTPRQAMKGAMR